MPPYLYGSGLIKDQSMPIAAISAPVAGLIGTGVGAVTGLIGQHSASSAAARADKIAADSSAAALAYQKERDAKMDAQAEAQWNAHQAQLQPYLAARASIFKRYGIPINTVAPVASGSPGAAVVAGARPMLSAAPPVPEEMQRSPLATQARQRLTLGDLPNWSGTIWGGR